MFTGSFGDRIEALIGTAGVIRAFSHTHGIPVAGLLRGKLGVFVVFQFINKLVAELSVTQCFEPCSQIHLPQLVPAGGVPEVGCGESADATGTARYRKASDVLTFGTELSHNLIAASSCVSRRVAHLTEYGGPAQRRPVTNERHLFLRVREVHHGLHDAASLANGRCNRVQLLGFRISARDAATIR